MTNETTPDAAANSCRGCAAAAAAELDTAAVAPYVPTLADLIREHLHLAHKSAKDYPDRMAMHLAVAAGIGYASATLDDAEQVEEDEQHALLREAREKVLASLSHRCSRLDGQAVS